MHIHVNGLKRRNIWKLLYGKTAGFCGGVKNAVTKAEEALENEKKIYCLGELVHNEEITKRLEEKGLITIQEIEQAPANSTVIIRAHGEPPTTYEKALERKISVIDLTCPKVLAIHKQAQNYEKEGYTVIYVAENGHPETIGTMGYLKSSGYLIQSEGDLEKIMPVISQKEKIAVLAQTTFSMEKFDKIVEKLNAMLKRNIEINKSICNATKIRQEETKKIASSVDAMIIIGGKNSSNTRKLYEIAKSITDAYLIQTVADLDKMDKYNKIGIMAGASTPNDLIQEVFDLCTQIC